jgi:hypothetical protein
VSPFVPKPHTPFQWERQDSQEETAEKLALLRSLFSTSKKMVMRWHEPAMSRLEGVLLPGRPPPGPGRAAGLPGRRAFFATGRTTSGLPVGRGLRRRKHRPRRLSGRPDPDAPLPWDHLRTGVSTAYLKLERRRARQGHVTPDCRFGDCSGCGVCSVGGRPSSLSSQAGLDIRPRTNRDRPEPPGEPQPVSAIAEDLTRKAGITGCGTPSSGRPPS